MTSTPKITIITPSYNQGEFLEQTLLSVINQNYPSIEYIMIDGGSTDNSLEIIRKYENFLTYWVSEKDKGQTDAINKGLKLATGEIVTWLNSDDYYEPGTLSFVAKYFQEHPGIGFLFGSVNYIDIGGGIIKLAPTKIGNDNYYYPAFPGQHMPQPASFFSKYVVDRIGILDPRFYYSMDADYWMRATYSGVSFHVVGRVLTNFRKHKDAKTTDGAEKFALELIDKYDQKTYRKTNYFKTSLFWCYHYLAFRSNSVKWDKVRFLLAAIGLRPQFMVKLIKGLIR